MNVDPHPSAFKPSLPVYTNGSSRMIHQEKRIDYGLIAAASVGLLAAWLTLRHGLPYGHDSAAHLYHLVERDHLIRQGLLFSRWSPYLSYGYGSPLYSYHASLVHYLAEPFVLIGFGPMLALRLLLGIALVSAAAGTYCWARDLMGSGPAVVAAAAFTFSPYFMFTLINRASFSEVGALALIPWSLWAFRRHALRRGRAYGVVGALTIAATLLSHLFSAYLSVTVLLLYAIALALTLKNTRPKPALVRHLLWPILLGLGLSAVFWLPAMAERHLIQVERVLLIADPAAGQELGPIWKLFTGPVLPDASMTAAVLPPVLSPVAAVLALLGLISLRSLRRDPELRVHLALGGLVVGASAFMHSPASRWLWQHLPLLRLGLFPFRFLTVGSLWLALLAGAGAAALLALVPAGDAGDQQKAGTQSWAIQTGLVAGLSLSLLLYTLGWPTIAVHSPDLPTGLEDALRFERQSGAIGLQAAGEYQPKTVRQHPPPESGPWPGEPRLDPESLPEDAQVIDAHYGPLRYTLTIDSQLPFQAIFRTFYFPGWQATVQGRPAALTPTDPYGLISLPVPAGRQEIELRFSSTAVRTGAALLSLLSALLTVALCFAQPLPIAPLRSNGGIESAKTPSATSRSKASGKGENDEPRTI